MSLNDSEDAHVRDGLGSKATYSTTARTVQLLASPERLCHARSLIEITGRFLHAVLKQEM